jgi:hypothetical protein
MKTIFLSLIAIVLCGCAQVQKPAPAKPFLSITSSSEPQSVIEPQWPTITLRLDFGESFDPASAYRDEWTNYWYCDALTSTDLTQPLSQWTVIPDVPLTIWDDGTLGFVISSNTPWLFITVQYRPKPALTIGDWQGSIDIAYKFPEQGAGEL